jgi:Protein of unknown function (DUF1236)
MADHPSRENQIRATRNVMVGGALIAAVLLIAGVAWLAVPRIFHVSDYVGKPETGAEPTRRTTAIGTGAPTQRQGESAVGKKDPAGQEDPTGGRARAIQQSSRSLSLSDEQREKLRTILAQQNPPRLDRANFELQIGASVPQQAPLADLPPEATQVLNGYWGDQCVIVGDTLVIVDQHSRRVAALVPGVA